MHPGAAAAAVLLAASGAVAGTQMTTITTTYQYNADGAPTAVTTQVDAQPATTTYLTWDNFVPNAAQPSTGTVSAADGNLLGIGASPGTTGLETQFAYDVRDRLISCMPSEQSAVSYSYHPASLMASSTLASGDVLQFYYDSSPNPGMVNTFQSSTGMASSFLGPVRYLSDGTEQVLLQPRKDTAGLYDAAAETLSPYAYDPYGAPLSAAATASTGLSADGTSYDLAGNPFQYAVEYQDPSCNAYYLRARWYLPSQRTFLSRDPADALHRYGYTGGNPIVRTDPSGLKYTGMDFSRDVDKAVHKLEPGIWAYIEPILPVWGQVMGGIEVVGLLPSFWHHPTAGKIINFGFLATSIVAEVGGESEGFDRLAPFLLHADRAFATRLGIEVSLGASQTAAQTFRHGRVDVPALIQGIDTTTFGIFYSRIVGGLGYRPYNMNVDDVDMVASIFHADDANRGQALVFAVREPLEGNLDYTTPIMQSKTVGAFHESLLVVSRDTAMSSEVNAYEFVRGSAIEGMAVGGRRFDWSERPLNESGISTTASYRYVGQVADSRASAVMGKSPLGIPSYTNARAYALRFNRPMDTPYDVLSSNCHDHVAGMIQLLQQP
jgi:RHS repeat-associated protein